MAGKILSGTLKQKLIQQALQRKLKNVANPGQGVKPTRPEHEEIADEFCRFDRLPGYKQIQIIYQGSQQLEVSNPFFRVHEGVSGATCRIDGEEQINFASYNYLGLSGHETVNLAAKEAIDRYGTSVSASRPVAGERPIHRALETALADAYAVEAAVVFVSGHATNVSTLGYLFGSRDLILHDELIHNSILVGAQLSGARRLSFPHNDLAALERVLRQQRNGFERVLIVVEGLYSMDGDFPDLPALIEIKRRHKAFLMVDEAHSFGVMGSHGGGIREQFQVAGRDVDIWMGTLSKSLAGCGGYIAGEVALVEQLKFLAPGFLYSVGLSPPLAAASLAALQLLQDEPERVRRLHARSDYFLRHARALGLDTGSCRGVAIIPIITGSSLRAARLSETLFKQGINVQPIIYPAVPEKSARLRFFLTCEHTERQIDTTLSILAAAWND